MKDRNIDKFSLALTTKSTHVIEESLEADFQQYGQMGTKAEVGE